MDRPGALRRLAREPSWSFPQVLIALAAITVVSGWVLANYYGESPGETFSAGSTDGWCTPADEGLGVHCFGDFQAPRLIAGDLENTWANHPGHAYLPTAMLPHIVSQGVAETPLGVRGSLMLYLCVLGVALLIPAAVSIWHGRARRTALLPLILLGVATQPFLSSLDRGNSVALAVPALLIFALSVNRRPDWVAPVAVVAAACIRPQFILIALAFVAFRRWRALLGTLVAFTTVQLAAFALWPGGFVHAIKGWSSNIAGYGGYADVTATTDANISAARGVVYVGRLLELGPGFIGDAGAGLISWVGEHPGVPGLTLCALVLIALVLIPAQLPRAAVLFLVLPLPALTPATSFGYYGMFTLVLGAMIWGPSALRRTKGRWTLNDRGVLDSLSGRLWRSWAWIALAATALALFPLPFRFAGGWNSGFLEITGLTWTLVVVGTIAVGCVSWATGRSSRSMR